MSKVKSGKGDVAKLAKKESKKPELSSVKDGRITKPAQTSKAKSKEIAKSAATNHLTKEKKKASKKVKEPTPEPESDSSDSSESESEDETSTSSASSDNEEIEAKTPAKTNGVAKATVKADDSSEASSADSEDDSEEDSEEESDSEVEAAAPKANGVKLNGVNKPAIKDDSSAEDEDDSSDESDSSEDSEDDKPAPKAAPVKAEKLVKQVKNEASSDEGSDDSDSGSGSADSEDDSDTSDSSDASESEKEQVPTKKRKAEAEAVPVAKKSKIQEETAENSRNLFVGNLSWNVDEEWLSREFQEFGEITGCRIITDKQSGRPKGFGYVEFASASDAKAALEAKHDQELDGRKMNIDYSQPRPPQADGGFQARSNDRAKRFGDQRSAPSDTLFIGNISFDATNDMISEAFQEYGTITRISLPTDQETGNPKGFGYVGFSSIDEAKAAIEGLHGMDIAGRPIRLDFATPRSNDGGSPRGGGFGGRGGRGGGRGGRGGFGDRGGRGRGGARGGRGGFSTNRGGFGDFKGNKVTF